MHLHMTHLAIVPCRCQPWPLAMLSNKLLSPPAGVLFFPSQFERKEIKVVLNMEVFLRVPNSRSGGVSFWAQLGTVANLCAVG